MKKNKSIGILCAVLSAVCYGTNPFGALPLYGEGVNTATVLAHRFGLAVILLAVVMLIKRENFKVTRHEFKVLCSLGLLFAASSITYYQSFHFMDAGIASTILFVYPVMVAVIMAAFFKERVTVTTIIAIVMSLIGIGLLYVHHFLVGLCYLYYCGQSVEHQDVVVQGHLLCHAGV